MSSEFDLHEQLSRREKEVITYLAIGMTNEEIGELLVISPATVQNHISHILDKLQLPNRTAVAAYCLLVGVIAIEIAAFYQRKAKQNG